MVSTNNIDGCFLLVDGFAFDIVRIEDKNFIKVTYADNTKYQSIHSLKDLKLIKTNMSKGLIEEYTPVLKRNASLIMCYKAIWCKR